MRIYKGFIEIVDILLLIDLKKLLLNFHRVLDVFLKI